ncbi:MAG: hypothetical protein HDT02_03580 [Bacteroidales bacterium]|nr:hypothetical protein [Bacteroidales bacterium]
MPKYNLRLTGYVGDRDFNRVKVAKCVSDLADTNINVLIDSTGGQLATGLAVAADFKNHGSVHVHLVSLNASAATVAAMGAASISMDRSAFFLVHKCSNLVFAWESMNADQLDDFINQMLKNKQDLDKIDESIAAMYAARCKKPVAELLQLMKEGKWLNAQEALDWGFIDKITDLEDDDAPNLTNSMADDFRAAGLPLPFAPAQKSENPFSSIFSEIRRFFSGNSAEDAPAAVVQVGNSTENSADDAPADAPIVNSTNKSADDTPAVSSSVVVSASDDPDGSTPDNPLASVRNHYATARDLFNSLP